MSSLQDFFHRVLTHETAIKKALEACEAEDIYAVDDLRLISNQNNLDKVFTQGTCAHISAALLPTYMYHASYMYVYLVELLIYS